MTDSLLGEIRMFAGDYAPAGWRICNGDVLSVSEYPELFSLIGAAFGGDGGATFALPNMKGRVAVGAGAGLTPRSVGATGGSETVRLNPEHLPAHSHPVNVSSGPATAAAPGPGVTFAAVDASLHFYVDTKVGSVTGKSDFAPEAITSVGGGQSHANVMPSLGVNYMICMHGSYPDFSPAR